MFRYSNLFKLHQGGKAKNSQALTQVSGWGEQMKPTQRQL